VVQYSCTTVYSRRIIWHVVQEGLCDHLMDAQAKTLNLKCANVYGCISVFYVFVLSFISYVCQFLMYYYVSCFGVFTAAKLVHKKKFPLIF